MYNMYVHTKIFTQLFVRKYECMDEHTFYYVNVIHIPISIILRTTLRDIRNIHQELTFGHEYR